MTAEDNPGREVFFRDLGNRKSFADFVPGDPRREWSGPGIITWASDQSEGDAGPGFDATQQAIADAMATWEGVICSDVGLTEFDYGNLDLGPYQAVVTGGAEGIFVPIHRRGERGAAPNRSWPEPGALRDALPDGQERQIPLLAASRDERRLYGGSAADRQDRQCRPLQPVGGLAPELGRT